ncbi:gluconokinase [Luteipulveratus sp. YIM 133132]|uniref:Gluconokinase n=1 Tax=Luteipulveratus flavus TaxID=3031728 RepID=A0ABT6C6X8_9MICO|nr:MULTISPECIES: gluconokinase [unclassified Luteipulveratus]MDE9364967.1 gluconokinase [Luteipulveratus sp. YIM 133132]MDF8264693.1 gluconokinase [Luteipulveratus sp. YIM 133296]
MSDASQQPQVVIVMGVSGSGKTTVAKGIAERMGWTFAEGDDFHPKSNVEKMKRGEPLTDEDRWPWLGAVGAWIDEQEGSGESAVVTCSALKRAYRDLLREGRPRLRFCHVDVDREVLETRLKERKGHYMPASLLASQLADLEPLQPDEPGVVVHAEGDPQEVLEDTLVALGLEPEPEGGLRGYVEPPTGQSRATGSSSR